MIVLKEVTQYVVIADHLMSSDQVEAAKDLMRDNALVAGRKVNEESWMIGPNVGGGWYVMGACNLYSDDEVTGEIRGRVGRIEREREAGRG